MLLAVAACARARSGCARRSRSPRWSWASRGRWSRRSGRRPRASATPPPSAPTTSRQGMARGARCRARPHRDPAHVRPLGGRVRVARLFARQRVAAAARRRAQQPVLRRPRADPRRAIGDGSTTTGSGGSRRRTRASTTRPWTRTGWSAHGRPTCACAGRLEHWDVYEVAGTPGLVRGGGGTPDGARAGVVHARRRHGRACSRSRCARARTGGWSGAPPAWARPATGPACGPTGPAS